MTKSIDERLTALEITVKEVDNAVFGDWDIETRRRRAGLLEQVNFLVAAVKWGVGPIITICLLLLLGQDSKEILPVAAKLFLAIAGH